MVKTQGNPTIDHIVKEGEQKDKLCDFARAYYKDANQWPIISRANGNIADDCPLKVGQIIHIP